MREELIGFVGIVIATLVSVTYNKNFKKKGSKNFQFIQRAKKKGCVTEGVAVSSVHRSSFHGHEDPYLRNEAETVKYKYEVNGCTYYKKMTFQSPGMVAVYYPDTVTIYYDQANPRIAVCPNETTKMQERQNRILGAIFVFIVTAFVVMNVLDIVLG